MIFYATPSERAFLEGLPETWREGLDLREETLTYADTEASARERMRTMRLTSPSLIAFRRETAGLTKEVEVERMLGALSSISMTEAELLDICFALGPFPLADLVSRQLRAAVDRNDVANAAATTELRHMVLQSLQSVPPLA